MMRLLIITFCYLGTIFAALPPSDSYKIIVANEDALEISTHEFDLLMQASSTFANLVKDFQFGEREIVVPYVTFFQISAIMQALKWIEKGKWQEIKQGQKIFNINQLLEIVNAANMLDIQSVLPFLLDIFSERLINGELCEAYALHANVFESINQDVKNLLHTRLIREITLKLYPPSLAQEEIQLPAIRIPAPTMSSLGTYIAYVKDGNMYIFPLATKKPVRIAQNAQPITFGFQDKFLLAQEEDAFILYELPTGALIKKIQYPLSVVHQACFTQVNDHLVILQEDRQTIDILRIADATLNSLKLENKIEILSPCGTYALLQAFNGSREILRIADQKIILKLKDYGKDLYVFSSDERYLGYKEHSQSYCTIYDVQALRSLSEIKSPQGSIENIVFSSDNQSILMQAGRQLFLFDLKTNKLLTTLQSSKVTDKDTLRLTDAYVRCLPYMPWRYDTLVQWALPLDLFKQLTFEQCMYIACVLKNYTLFTHAKNHFLRLRESLSADIKKYLKEFSADAIKKMILTK